MAKIFVSYRRADADTDAGRITDWLDNHFGDADVFMDIDAIGPGENFKLKIQETVGSIDALVAVIGTSWVQVADAQGRRRLDDPNDILRLEIANALRREILVVPVLVQGAPMPRAEELPDDLKPLCDLNALALSNLTWKPLMARLIAKLDSVVGQTPQPATPVGQPEVGAGPVLAGLVGVALLLAGILVRGSSHETFLHPGFGGPDSFNGSNALWRLAGVFTSATTVGIAAVAVAGLLWARRSERLPFATGLVLSAGVLGTALYGDVLAGDHTAGFVMPLLGGLLVLGSGAWLFRALRTGVPEQALDLTVRVSAVAGGVATLVGMAVKFNRGGPGPEHRYASSVFSGDHVERWELLVAAVMAIGVALVLPRLLGSRQLAAGLLLGTGVATLCLWPRYIAIPMLEVSRIASPGLGGFIGLFGAALIAYAGIAAHRAVATNNAVAPAATTANV